MKGEAKQELGQQVTLWAEPVFSLESEFLKKDRVSLRKKALLEVQNLVSKR